MQVMGLSGFVKNKIVTRLMKDSLQDLEMFLVPTYRSSFTSTKGRFSKSYLSIARMFSLVS